jgi:NAD(P)-dependent dehydrogenase (short-subunit alcohol dehydrogenase family)
MHAIKCLGSTNEGGLSLPDLTSWMSAGIRVNAIRPGVVKTSIFGPDMTPEKIDAFGASVHLMPRAGTTEEIGKLTSFLLSDDSSFITGSLIDIDGGFAIK